MNNRFLRSLQFYLALIDFTAVIAVFFTAHFLFRHWGYIGTEEEYMYFGFFLSISWLLLVMVMNIYNEKHVMSFELFTKGTMHTYLYFLLILVIYLFFFRMIELSRYFIIVILAAIPLALLANRFVYLAIYQYFKGKDYLMSKVVVIGYNNLSKKLVNYLEEDGIHKEIVGYCEEYENVDELSHYPILSGIDRAFEVCKEHGITEIYSTIAPEHNDSIYRLIQKADQNCIRFKIVPDLGFFINKKMYIDYLKEIPVMMLRKEPLEDLGNRIKKRAFDIVISSLVVIFLLSWMIPLLGLLIWLESRGPVFFTQPRSGKDNKVFNCLKFRSMRQNANAHLKQASRDDSRITRIGRFMRRTSLDEFPQFINVLKGEMSIVGPRPHMLKHTDEYSKLIGMYMVRQFLKPGITGWAQVNGHRGETQKISHMQQRVEHDLWYLENWSLVLDLKIMYMTVFNTFKGDEKAY
jgi:putative colanic acid biosynthesis UDP-glucose lipid carrier transferase